MDAIILAGGLGTRLRGVIGEYPKCMATVAGKPFLYYLHRYLRQQGIQRIIHSLGYKHEVVTQYLQEENTPQVLMECVIEHTPLGTGGGIKLAMLQAQSNEVLVLNGDTFFDVTIQDFKKHHAQQDAVVTLALKPMSHFDRYGTVSLDAQNRVTAFHEKQPTAHGLINGGVYLINRTAFLATAKAEKFSFEQDYLAPLVQKQKVQGLVSDGFFIDIGIPDDFAKAQNAFQP